MQKQGASNEVRCQQALQGRPQYHCLGHLRSFRKDDLQLPRDTHMEHRAWCKLQFSYKVEQLPRAFPKNGWDQ